jgi:hypothetical protein
MALLHFRSKERRRTLRVTLTVPVAVHGQDECETKFCAHALTHTVSRNGALLVMDQTVVVGQTLLLVNESSNRTAECRVVSIRRDRESKTFVGVEFMSGDANFWHMTFPMPGARPLRRPLRERALA